MQFNEIHAFVHIKSTFFDIAHSVCVCVCNFIRYPCTLNLTNPPLVYTRIEKKRVFVVL